MHCIDAHAILIPLIINIASFSLLFSACVPNCSPRYRPIYRRISKRNWIPPCGLIFIHNSLSEYYANRQTFQHILIVGHKSNVDPRIISFNTEQDQVCLLYNDLNHVQVNLQFIHYQIRSFIKVSLSFVHSTLDQWISFHYYGEYLLHKNRSDNNDSFDK